MHIVSAGLTALNHVAAANGILEHVAEAELRIWSFHNAEPHTPPTSCQITSYLSCIVEQDTHKAADMFVRPPKSACV